MNLKTYIGCRQRLPRAGDINFIENWYTTEYMKEQPDGLWDYFSEDLLAQMQGVDVMIMNNEFTYVNKKGATSVYGKAYTFRADQKAELLEIFGTDTVTLANNHVYEYGKRITFMLDVLIRMLSGCRKKSQRCIENYLLCDEWT